MKKILSVLAVLVLVSAVSFGAMSTVTSQDATKTGLEGFRSKVNANFALLPGTIVSNVTITAVAPVTNVTITAVAPVTNVTITLQSVTLTDTNGVTASVVTNATLTLERGAAPALTVQSGAAPTITVQSKTP